MPVELPTFGDGQGLMLCVCGELESADSVPVPQGPQVIKYTTQQGEVFARAEITAKARLYVNCARSLWFGEDRPKVTTKKKQDLFRIIESAYGLRLKATICASFRVPLMELPETGLIRSLTFESKSAAASIKMTGASFALTGAPFIQLRWRSITTKENVSVVHIDTRTKRELQVSEKFLTELWSQIYAEFSVWAMGGRDTSTAPPSK